MPSLAATYTAWLTMKPMIRPASSARSAATSAAFDTRATLTCRRMALSRSDLLARAGLALGATTLARVEAAEAAPLDASDWRSVRAQFALDQRFHHLAGFLLAPHPRRVREAIARYRRALDANPSEYLHAHGNELEARVRGAAADYLGASVGQIALTDSTTMGLGLLYGGLRLRPGDEILTTEHDFFATHEALRLRGGRVRRIRLYERLDRVSVDEIVGSIRRAITPRTRVVAVTWVHSSTGLKLPIRAIAEALPRRALLCVDGVHGLGVESATVRELGCDFLVAGCHKWLAGPRGTGLVWGRDWSMTRATIPSFDAAGGPPSALAMTPGGFHSFEHRWALTAAFRLHREIGKARVRDRVHALAGRLKDGLAEMRHVRLQTPRDSRLSAGIVCLEVVGLSAREAVQRLLREHRVIASVTPYATEYVRLGPGLYTSDDDVDATLQAVRALRAP
jgi:selenocysteine lyase/cysteine desulfurase